MRNYYFLETLKIVLGSSIIHYLYPYLLGVFFKIPIHIKFSNKNSGFSCFTGTGSGNVTFGEVVCLGNINLQKVTCFIENVTLFY